MEITINGILLNSESAVGAFRLANLRDITKLQTRITALALYYARHADNPAMIDHQHFAAEEIRKAESQIDILIDHLKQLDEKLTVS